MDEDKKKQLEVATGPHTDIVTPPARSPNGGLEFFKDLLTGFTALLLFLFLMFICLPLVMIGLKVGLFIAIPLLYFGVIIICIALLGRLVRVLILKK
jgi:hypothetical protein